MRKDSTDSSDEVQARAEVRPNLPAPLQQAQDKKRSRPKAPSTRSALFRSLVQNSYDNIMLLAEDGTILYTTPSITRLLGYEPDELIGLDGFNLIHPDDQALVETAFARLII